MTVPASLHMLVQISASQLLNSIAQGIAIAFFAWIALHIAPRQGAVTRFAVWFSALVVIAALPLAGVLGFAGGAASLRRVSAAITLPGSWAIYLFALWGAIAAVALLKLAVGLARLVILRRSCAVVQPESLDPRLLQTLREFSSTRRVMVCTSDSLRIPAAIGFFHPAVVFPSWAMEELSAAELNSILLHELAHLARRDDWTNLAQKVLRCVFFFHPAVWWIESKLSLEREMACDDIVLAHTANPRAYAECLVSLTEKGLLRRGLALVQAAISHVQQTALRVAQILDKKRSGTTRVYRPLMSALGAFSVACLAASPHAPSLVSFAGSAPSPGISAVARVQTEAAPESLRHLDASAEMQAIQAARITNAGLHVEKDFLGHRPATARNDAKETKLIPARARVPRTPPARFLESRRIARPAVVLVVTQDRFYDATGQMLLSVSIYRFTAVRPDIDQGINPKKI